MCSTNNDDLGEILDILDHSKSISSYAFEIRSLVRDLYNTGNIGGFSSNMLTTVDRNLSAAWFAGMRSCGIDPDDITEREDRARLEMILISNRAIAGFADAIIQGRQNEVGVTTFYSRVDIWANRWGEAYNRARSMACADKKLKWVVGPTEHCEDCAALEGKVKRASVWDASGVLPRTSVLACGGWRCQCSLVETSEPISRGPLPGLSGISFGEILSRTARTIATGTAVGTAAGTVIGTSIVSENEED